MKKIEFTEYENNYINDSNTYRDDSENVYIADSYLLRELYVVAKPVGDSLSGYKFKNESIEFAQNLLRNSQGYDIRIKRDKDFANICNVIAKPISANAELRYDCYNSYSIALRLIQDLRRQEILIGRKLSNRVKKEPMTEEDLYESLFGAIEDNMETDGKVVVSGTTIYTTGNLIADMSLIKRLIYTNDYRKDIGNATKTYDERLGALEGEEKDLKIKSLKK